MNGLRLTAIAVALFGALQMLAARAAIAADGWYEVELIVFAQRQPQAGNEQWPEAPGLPERIDALPLPTATQTTPGRLLPLPAAEYRLQNEAQALAADANYELLLHTGWRQVGVAKEQAFAVQLRAPAADEATVPTPAGMALPARLDGTVRLILSRYLHLETNLVYRDASAADSSETPSAEPQYRLRETRRMRSKEVHYLDHPMFGVIALVTPFEPPAATPASAPAPRRN